MNIDRILVATDFSECSDTALEFASRLADQIHAQLFIIHVDEVANAQGRATVSALRREIREKIRRMRPTIATVLYKHLSASGSPVEEILKAAEQENIDVIVIGSHGRTGLAKLLTGSVAEGVMRQAECPVLIVKQPLRVIEDVSDVVATGPPG
jgi:nucleotide-binding universal stress UspA family protein